MVAEYIGLIDEMRSRQPLVHNITNYVVMNFTANA
jgi:hydroxyethylthiazole kinase-like sugar kinase family protein